MEENDSEMYCCEYTRWLSHLLRLGFDMGEANSKASEISRKIKEREREAELEKLREAVKEELKGLDIEIDL